MATQWISLSFNEHPDSQINVINDINIVNFGDGYSQRAPNGLYFKKHQYKLVYRLLEDPDKTNLLDFLNLYDDGTTMEKDSTALDGVTRQWWIKDWTAKYSTPLAMDFEITLMEAFN